MRLRRELHSRGLRYRVERRIVGRGRVDVVFARARVAVFVDGCFWHRCPEHGTVPKTNRDWWEAKLEANVDRDRRATADLERAGYEVIRIWEHEDVEAAATRVQQVVKQRLAG